MSLSHQYSSGYNWTSEIRTALEAGGSYYSITEHMDIIFLTLNSISTPLKAPWLSKKASVLTSLANDVGSVG